MTEQNNDNDNNSLESSFWKHNYTVTLLTFLMISISSIFMLINFFVLLWGGTKPGFDLANSIVLFTASIAISGTFYSNYRNDILNKRQILEAEKRLDKQLDKQDERLKEQLKSSKQNLKDQLEHNEKQLKTQLIFDKERTVMLEIYNILFQNRASVFYEIEDPDTPYFISERRDSIYLALLDIQKDIKQFYYIPVELRGKILIFTMHILSKKEEDPYYYFYDENKTPEKHKSLYFDDKNIETLLKEIYAYVEEYFKLPMNR